ncbi:hypothetical protein [Herbaspirillum sp. SJZ107]|uniref:hypothetical protein n=1 Tax=Herbaspirillum sp. SJZ107 TaxID=2572881 RepID=UPI0011508475|nr:hypothetical protein [Herbaspirillum sp. SJZ107]
MSAIKAAIEDSIHSIMGRRPRPASTNAVQTAEDLSRENRILAERKKELESAVNKLQRENSTAKAQKVEADNHLRTLQAEHTGLREKHIALEKDRDALKAISVRRAKVVKTVADRISRNLAVHAGELITELPLRAAPYVGVATLVAGTAVDIKSDCELSRTLNDLVVEHQEAPLDTHAVCQYADKIPTATQVWTMAKSQADKLTVPVYQVVERLYRR